MKTCGIVAEYNPFHNGHAYHVQQAKEKSQADIIVAIMSGNYVQRGELAILDKWTRAKAAILHGVDVVVEMPSVFAIQSADYFGLGAMKIARVLQLDSLAFGVESGNVEQLKKVANDTLTVPKDFTQTYQQQWVKQHELLQTPNNQLAVAYIRALKQLNYDMTLVPIPRINAQHGQITIEEKTTIASATAIRQAVWQQKDVHHVVSEYIAKKLRYCYNDTQVIQFLGEHYFWQLLQYQLTICSVDQLRYIYQMSEGIEYVLKKAVNHANSLEQFIALVQSKRWHKKRVQRLCCYIVLHITHDWVQSSFQQDISAIRVLALSKKGTQFIRKQDVQMVTQFKQRHITWFQEQIRFDKLYEQITQSGEQNFRRLVVNNYESHSKT